MVAAVEEVEATPADRIAELEGRMGIEGREPELLVDLAEALLETGETAMATGRLEEALASFEARSYDVSLSTMLTSNFDPVGGGTFRRMPGTSDDSASNRSP